METEVLPLATVKTPQKPYKDLDFELEGIIVTTDSGYKFEDHIVGDGASPQLGNIVEIHYTAKLDNGQKIDSSHDRNQTFEFELGDVRIPPALNDGLLTMSIGGKRTISFFIPDLSFFTNTPLTTIAAPASLLVAPSISFTTN